MAGPLDAAALELARAFDHNNLPAKLRCASCNRLAVDAVKLPCCDQAICEPCSKDLSDTCPVCEHSPIVAEECKPHKNLRMTVRAFLKSEEKKRSKETNIPAPVQPSIEVSATPAPAVVKTSASLKEESVQVGAQADEQIDNTQGEAFDEQPFADQAPAVIEENTVDEDEDEDEDDIVVTTEKDPNANLHDEQPQLTFEQENNVTEHEQSQMDAQQNFGYGQNQQGFGNMNFNNMNGFNPMMAMQNGMGMPGFNMGMPNMMGMPGMNMDPSMVFNGGFGGMGMNDMSMMGLGMGMGNFGGMPGMGGMGEPGFFHEQGGYNNHQNFGNNMHQNFRNDRGFGRPYGRGFGRGRGFNGYNRGRGGFGFQQQQNFGHNQGYMQNGPQQQQNVQAQQAQAHPSAEPTTEPGAARASPNYEPMNAKIGSAKDGSSQPPHADGEADASMDTNGANAIATNAAGIDDSEVPHQNGALNGGTTEGENRSGQAEAAVEGSDGGAQVGAIQTYTSDDVGMQQGDYPVGANGMSGQDGQPYGGQYQQYGYGQRVGGFIRGRGGYLSGRGGFGYGSTTEAKELTATPAPPINAPTGPKAMREGKPNTGFNPKLVQMQAQAQAPPTAPSQPADIRLKHSVRDERERSNSRSRSRSRHRSSKRHHRSDSEGTESEESRQRRKDRERRKRKDRDRRGAEDRAETDDAGRKGRSRDESVVEDSSSSRRRRDKEDEHRSSRSHRDRSRDHDRHKHRNRSRSPAKESSANGDTDSKSRHKSRRDRKYDEDDQEHGKRDSDSRRRHSHRADEDRSSHRDTRDHREKTRAVLEQPLDDIGFKIKGSKSAAINPAGMGPPRRSTSDKRRQSDASLSGAAPADPYAAEREKRHAERMLKEQQRRQGSSLGKRASREDEEEFDAPRGPKGDGGGGLGGRKRKERKVSVRYEGEVGEGLEERDFGRRR